MELDNKRLLEKLKRKNKGNKSLASEIDQLVDDIESHDWKNQTDLKISRTDADCVHSDGFYFFNIAVHRAMILIGFEEGEATVVWTGNHQQYEAVFKNNKNVIRKWLKSNEWI